MSLKLNPEKMCPGIPKNHVSFSTSERNVIRIVRSWQPQSYLVSKNFHVQLYLDICSQRRLAQSHPQDDIACQIGILA